MRIGLFRRYEDIQRLREIADILIRHGFGYIAKALGLYSHLPFRWRIIEPKLTEQLPLPIRARKILEELGPTYIKFGQVLSTRSDIFPQGYIREFSKLLDQVPPFSYDEVKNQIEKEFGAPIHTLFESFEREPYASASIGQVHMARLITGEKVIVKVQRPGIEEVVEADIDLISSLAGLLEKHMPETRPYEPTGIVKEFAKTIRREMDYTREGRNADKFRRNFEGIDYVCIPKVYWNLSSKKVLTLEYLEGIKANDIEKLDSKGYDKKRIAEKIAKTFLKQVYVDGLFQGDPHPANILVMEGETIGFIDFGMIGRIDRDSMNKFVDLFVAIINYDLEKIAEKYLEIGVIGPDTNIRDFKLDVGELIEQYYGIPLREIDMATLLNDLLGVATEHYVRVPSNFSLFIKGAITVESLARQLDPDFDLSIIAEPFVKNLIKKRLQPKAIALEFIKDISDFGETVVRVPRRLERVLEKIENDQVTIEHRGFDRLLSELDTASNRLSFALITSAIIVSSALIMQIERGPMIFGLPFFGLLGLLSASIFGTILLIIVVRSGKL